MQHIWKNYRNYHKVWLFSTSFALFLMIVKITSSKTLEEGRVNSVHSADPVENSHQWHWELFTYLMCFFTTYWARSATRENQERSNLRNNNYTKFWFRTVRHLGREKVVMNSFYLSIYKAQFSLQKLQHSFLAILLAFSHVFLFSMIITLTANTLGPMKLFPFITMAELEGRKITSSKRAVYNCCTEQDKVSHSRSSCTRAAGHTDRNGSPAELFFYLSSSPCMWILSKLELAWRKCSPVPRQSADTKD